MEKEENCNDDDGNNKRIKIYKKVIRSAIDHQLPTHIQQVPEQQSPTSFLLVYILRTILYNMAPLAKLGQLSGLFHSQPPSWQGIRS